jgi:hypothetical protein
MGGMRGARYNCSDTLWCPLVAREKTMLRILLSGLALGVLSCGMGTAKADDAPRAIIEKAIKAQGGAGRVSPPGAVKTKVKGVYHDETLGDLTFTGETVSQFPSQVKHAVDIGGVLTIVEVLNGNQGWLRDNEKVDEVDPAALVEMQNSAYVDYVATLFPLLQEKAFALSGLGEAKVQGRPAVGVKVEARGKPGVGLFFDKESGLLVKTQHRGRDARTKKEILKEELFRDYKEVLPAGAENATLEKAKLLGDDAALLDFVRKRTLPEAELAKLNELVRKLGDSAFEVREKAKQDLLAQGTKAIPALARATKDSDAEVRDTAKECLQRIGKIADYDELAAVIRQLARRQTPGAVEALLAYVPSAPDEKMAQEVQGALLAVAYRDGRPDKALTQALEDKDPLRRDAAKAVLAGDGKKARGGPGHTVLLFGFKMPMKGEEYNDGKKVWEWEATEIQFFDKLEDSVFGKP